jgi:phosphoribosylanthranilate isomerase
MVRVKICGITNLEDALKAVEYGADALGFVFFRKSPRQVTAEAVREITSKLPPYVTTVGVFVDEDPKTVEQVMRQARLDAAQLHGEEPPEACRLSRPVIKAIRVCDAADIDKIEGYDVSGFLLDTYLPDMPGGTGRKFNWEHAASAVKRFGRPIILAGGLTDENVEEAIKQVQPYGVDVSSSVEREKGRKDHEKLRLFIQRAKEVIDWGQAIR